MSIATDEAARRWPDSQALQQPSMDDMYGAWSREAFVLGAAWQRGREPTEAEIKAAVRAMYYSHADYWESDEDYARYLLEAARKAVTE